MRILMLAHRIPYPPHTGDKTRAYHIVRHLARLHDLTLGFLVDERWGSGWGVRAPGRGWGSWSSGGSGSHGACSRARLDSNGRRRQCRVFSVSEAAAEAARRVDASGYDLVYASSTPMAQYARRLGLPVVMDFVDVDSDKWAQYGRHSRAVCCVGSTETEGRRLQAVEAEIARWSDRCVLATRAEETLLSSFAPWARTAVIPNGIELEYFRPAEGEDACPGDHLHRGDGLPPQHRRSTVLLRRHAATCPARLSPTSRSTSWD